MDDQTPTLDDLLDEVAALIEQPERQPGEFTAKEYAARRGISADLAGKRLEKAANDGLIERRKAGRFNFYRMR